MFPAHISFILKPTGFKWKAFESNVSTQACAWAILPRACWIWAKSFWLTYSCWIRVKSFLLFPWTVAGFKQQLLTQKKCVLELSPLPFTPPGFEWKAFNSKSLDLGEKLFAQKPVLWLYPAHISFILKHHTTFQIPKKKKEKRNLHPSPTILVVTQRPARRKYTSMRFPSTSRFRAPPHQVLPVKKNGYWSCLLYPVRLLDLSEKLLPENPWIWFYHVPAGFEQKTFDSNIPVGFEWKAFDSKNMPFTCVSYPC